MFLFAEGHYVGISGCIRLDVLDGRNRWLNEGRYDFNGRVNQVPDSSGRGQVLQVVKPVVPVVWAIKDKGLRGLGGHSDIW